MGNRGSPQSPNQFPLCARSDSQQAGNRRQQEADRKGTQKPLDLKTRVHDPAELRDHFRVIEVPDQDARETRKKANDKENSEWLAQDSRA